MRTTIRIDDELLARAKELAARTHGNLSSVVEDALREMMARREKPRHRPVTLTTFGGNGSRPGVDLDDTAALYDLMDAGEAA